YEKDTTHNTRGYIFIEFPIDSTNGIWNRNGCKHRRNPIYKIKPYHFSGYLYQGEKEKLSLPKNIK
ncbi:MAG TPA: hypothetical protein VK074_14485, partial [Fodinibius sp.]|nr:hypothetical protein [Fodinibius sp.]